MTTLFDSPGRFEREFAPAHGLRDRGRDRDRDRDELVRPEPEVRDRDAIPLQPKPTKARIVKWKLFEATAFLSTAASVGASGDDSLEGQIERWRRTAGEFEFLDWEWTQQGGTHYMIIRYTE